MTYDELSKLMSDIDQDPTPERWSEIYGAVDKIYKAMLKEGYQSFSTYLENKLSDSYKITSWDRLTKLLDGVTGATDRWEAICEMDAIYKEMLEKKYQSFYAYLNNKFRELNANILEFKKPTSSR
jgi:hypothetical protein